MNNISNTIVAFHIGRGGKNNNPGYIRFLGTKEIGDFIEGYFLNPTNHWELLNAIGNRDNILELYYQAIQGMQNFEIDHYIQFERRTGLVIGALEWTNENGTPIGLTFEQYDEGIGIIEIDTHFDTTYTKYLQDCNEDEVKLIVNSMEWNADYLIEELIELDLYEKEN